jgi:formyltetrahydrofolate deformylase
MAWRIALSSHKPRMAILVSKHDHCLMDLLYRHRIGQLACEIVLIVGNHPDAQRGADFFGVPYYLIPVTKANKPEAERCQLELLKKYGVDLIVLARYMQVLSSDFIRRYQHSLFVLACLCGSQAASAGIPTRREVDWSNRTLRDRSP